MDRVEELSTRALGSIPNIARLMRVPLTSTLTPSELLRTARFDRHVFGLVGDWAGGGAVIGSDPLATCGETDDPFDVIDRVPELDGDPVQPAPDVGSAAVGSAG